VFELVFLCRVKRNLLQINKKSFDCFWKKNEKRKTENFFIIKKNWNKKQKKKLFSWNLRQKGPHQNGPATKRATTKQAMPKWSRHKVIYPCPGASTREELFWSLCQSATCYFQSNYSKVEEIPLSALPKNTTCSCEVRLYSTLSV